MEDAIGPSRKDAKSHKRDPHVCWLAKIHFSLNKSLKTGLFFSEGAFLHFQNFKAPSGSLTFGPSARNLMSKGEGAGGHSVATRGDRPLINADGTSVGLGMFLRSESSKRIFVVVHGTDCVRGRWWRRCTLCRLGQEIGCIQSERASRVHPIIQRMKILSKAD